MRRGAPPGTIGARGRAIARAPRRATEPECQPFCRSVAHDLAERAYERRLEPYRLTPDRRRRRASGALVSTVVTSRFTLSESMPALFLSYGVHCRIDGEMRTRCTLWSLLPTHRSTCAFFTILFQLRHRLVGMSAYGGLCGAVSERVGNTRSGLGEGLDVDISGHFVRIDTFDLVAGNRGIVQELGRVADRRENLAGVEIARREAGRKRRARGGESTLAGRSYPRSSLIHVLPAPERISAVMGVLPSVMPATTPLRWRRESTMSRPTWIGCCVNSASCWLVGAPLMSTLRSTSGTVQFNVSY